MLILGSRNSIWTSFKEKFSQFSKKKKNDAIKTDYVKAKIDKTQQNSKCKLYGDRDETINHIISECCRLAQKEYKTWHDWEGKVIYC